ncbi:MAG: hypothetical protein NTW78_00860 [Campylobacterales bacterium]|nr:hypothetical protein [Campylobacterales bacterium]
MKLLYFFVISLLFSTSVFADSKYVLVTKTKSQAELPYIKAKLKKLELNIVTYKSGDEYSVYSGAFKNYKSAIIALQSIQSYFPEAAVVSFDSHAVEEETRISKGGYYFINGSLASLGVPFDHSVQKGNITTNSIGTSAMGYIFEAGYNFENNIFMTLSYLNAASTTNTISNLYGTINYKMRMGQFEPYIGVLGGLSTLSWTKPPMLNATSGADSALLYGAQTGLSYDTGFSNLALFINYQFAFMNHETPLAIKNTTNTITASSTLTQNIIQGINLGVQYRF